MVVFFPRVLCKQKNFQNCYIGSSHNYTDIASHANKVELTSSGDTLSDSGKCPLACNCRLFFLPASSLVTFPLPLSAVEAEDEMEERNVSRNPVLEGPVRTVPVVKVNEEWGVATHLGGLLSSVTLFSDVIPSATIKTIYHYGKA